MRIALALLAGCLPLAAQAAHPRLLLDAEHRATLMAHVTANDATWTAWKADADYYLDKTFAPYAPGTCTQTTQVCFTGGLNGSYEGSGWYSAAHNLGLAYQLTGNAAYAAKLRELIAVINASWDGRADCSTYGSTGSIPPSIDGGYGWRSFMVGIGLAYDWIHDQLTTEEKNALGATAGCFYDFAWSKNVNNFRSHNAMFNYSGGFLIGAGAIAYSMQGEQANAAKYINYVTEQWANQYAPAFATGPLQGGCPTEGYNHYGFDHFLNILEYLEMRKTSGNGNVLGTILDKMTSCMIYALQPSRWRTWHEAYGAMPSGVMWGELPMYIAAMAPGVTAGAYAQYFLNQLALTPSGADPKIAGVYFGASTIRKWNFLYRNDSRAATDYRAALPTYYDDGANMFFVRSDWTDSAIWSQFTYSADYIVSHAFQSYGNIKVARGADYLLINGQMWQGINGDTGAAPTASVFGSQWRANALFLDDRGAYCEAGHMGCANPTSVDGQGHRLGIWAGVPAKKAAKLTGSYAYAKSELTAGYDGDQWQQSAANRTLRHWWRSYAWLGDGYFIVYDRVQAKAATPMYDKRMFWHLPPNTLPASWTAPSINGNKVESARVGNSRLVLNTVSPATAVTTFAYDPMTSVGSGTGVEVVTGNAANRNTMRVEVTDPTSNTMNPVTVIMALGAGDSTPAHGALLSIDANHVGAYVIDTIPRIALFSADGTAQYAASFTQAFAGTANVLVADLAPGAYEVRQDGVVILPGAVVNAGEGTLFFKPICAGCTGAFEIQALFSIQQTSLPDGSVGVPYAQTLSTAGGTGPYTYAVTAGSLPAGLALSSGGVITGSPAAGGLTTVTITATDMGNANRTTQATFSLTVAWQPLKIKTTVLGRETIHTAYTQTLSAGGGNGVYGWSVVAGILPAGLALSAGGTLAGVPVSTGPSSFTVACTSGDGQTAQQTYSSVTAPALPASGFTGAGVRGVGMR